jgi:opacity protein-like surface antigen
MKTILFIVLLAISLATTAQKSNYADFLPQATFGVGISFQKFDGLNSRIAKFPEYQSLRGETGTLQLGWLKERNKLVSVFNVMVSSSMSGDRDKKSSVIRSIGLGGDIGYDLAKSERILFYPMAGIGYEWYQARFYKDNSSVDFDDVLDSPETENSIRSVDFKNSFFTYHLGVGVSVKSPKMPSKSIGLQAGYTGSFSNRDWKSNQSQALRNPPEDNLSRFQIALIFGSQPTGMKH